MTVKTVGDWKKAEAILKAAPAKLKDALEQATLQEAEHLAGAMKRQFRGLKPPLSSSTLITRKGNRNAKGQFSKGGGSKPLNRSGDLRNSITVVPGIDGDASAFIGIPRSNKQATDLAIIHEFGKTIVQRMTARQQRFLHAVLPRLPEESKAAGIGGTGVIVIHIPARPFIRPVFTAEGPKIPERFVQRVVKLLGDMSSK